MVMARYINPFTDVGFKRIFGQEVSKPLLIDFLNNVLERNDRIIDLTFLDKEQVAVSPQERGIIYDVYCEADNGEKFIVEMQNKRQEFFVDRCVYYVSHAIARQGERGAEWRYQLAPVYLIAFMNFTLKDLQPRLRTEAVFMDTSVSNALSDKAHMIFLQLPYFNKEAEECVNDFERWIYTLKNMETLQRMPFAAQNAVFQKLSEITDLSKLSGDDRVKYDYSLKQYRDAYNVFMTNYEEGLAEGREEGLVKGREEGLAAGREEGLAAGREEGLVKGREEGLAAGREEGLAAGREEGLAAGREEGLAAGRMVAQREMARKMKAMGLDAAMIVQATGLSREETDQL